MLPWGDWYNRDYLFCEIGVDKNKSVIMLDVIGYAMWCVSPAVYKANINSVLNLICKWNLLSVNIAKVQEMQVQNSSHNSVWFNFYRNKFIYF